MENLCSKGPPRKPSRQCRISSIRRANDSSLLHCGARQFPARVLMAGRARLNILEALMGTIGGLRTFGLLGVFFGRRARFSATVALREQAAPAPCPVASHHANP